MHSNTNITTSIDCRGLLAEETGILLLRRISIKGHDWITTRSGRVFNLSSFQVGVNTALKKRY